MSCLSAVSLAPEGHAAGAEPECAAHRWSQVGRVSWDGNGQAVYMRRSGCHLRLAVLGSGCQVCWDLVARCAGSRGEAEFSVRPCRWSSCW